MTETAHFWDERLINRPQAAACLSEETHASYDHVYSDKAAFGLTCGIKPPVRYDQ